TAALPQGGATRDALGNADDTNFMTAFDASGNQPFTISLQPTRGQNWGMICGATPVDSAEVAYGHGMDAMAVRDLRIVSAGGTATPLTEWGVQGEVSEAGWLDVDRSGNTLEVGRLMTPIHVGGVTIAPAESANGDNPTDIYVVKRDPEGVVLRAGRIGTSSLF